MNRAFNECFFAALLSLLFLQGCSSVIRKPELPSTTLSDLQFKQLKVAIQDTSYHDRYVRALYNVKISDGNSSSSLRYAIISKPPQRFRLESLPANGFYTLSLLTINSTQAEFFDKANNKRIKSDDIDRLVQEELSLPIPAKFLPYLFVGRVPANFIEDYNYQAYNVDADTKLVVDQAKTIYWYIDSTTFRLKSVQFWDQFNDQLKLQINYLQFSQEADLHIPAEIELLAPAHDFMMNLKLQQVKLSTTVPDALFEFAQ